MSKTASDASLSAKRRRLEKLQKEVSDKQETVDILSMAKGTTPNELRMALLSLEETKKQKMKADAGDASNKPSRFHQISLRVMGPILTDEDEQKVVVLSAKADLGRKREETEFLAEEIRVEEVVQKRSEEINLESKLENCPICLDTIYYGHPSRKIGANSGISYFSCCGKETCMDCFKEHGSTNFGEGTRHDRCPLCRSSFNGITKEMAQKRVHERAGSGDSKAQFLLSEDYFEESRFQEYVAYDSKEMSAKALDMLRKSAEGGYPEAQAKLGFFYQSGAGGFVPKSKDIALKWFERAASCGHIMAHYNLAHLYTEEDKVLDMLTFAAQHGVIEAQVMIGLDYMGGSQPGSELGLPMSLERAKYWLQKTVHKDTQVLRQLRCTGVYSKYSLALLGLLQQNLDGHVDVVGESRVPEILYWHEKAVDVGNYTQQDLEMANMFHSLGKQQCALCKRQRKHLKRCTKCKWASYCGRECQLNHWNQGHKTECKKKY